MVEIAEQANNQARSSPAVQAVTSNNARNYIYTASDNPQILDPQAGLEVLDQSDKQTMHKDIQEPRKTEKAKSNDDYIKAFIDNKMFKQVIPDIMNYINIAGNTIALAANLFGVSDAVKNVTKAIASFSTKSFMLATSVINIVERLYTKNFLCALGFFNDILIAGLVGQNDTYLARGFASGTYNTAFALNIAGKKDTFNTVDEHIGHLAKTFKDFFANLLSPKVLNHFFNSEKAMNGVFGGLLANIGSSMWLLTGKVTIPTLIRDIGGVIMDLEQLNPGHLTAGRKTFFMSGVALVVGTISDYFSRIFPSFADHFVNMTFIFDGIGRHLLRLHQNEQEGKENQKQNEIKVKQAQESQTLAQQMSAPIAVPA